MNRLALVTVVTVAAVVIAPAAQAGKGGSPVVPTLQQQKKNDNKAFIGLQWNFGVREGLSGVIGYRWAKVGFGDNVRGTHLDFTFALTGQTGPGEIHLKAFDGQRDVQGEIGIGYGFHARAFLVNAGVQGPHVNAGADYLFGKGLQPYVGVNTIRRYKAAPDQLTCPTGYSLVGSSCTD